MKKRNTILKLSLLACILILQSCANYKLHYNKANQDWAEKQKTPSNMAIDHTVFLIGDAGNYSSIEENPTLQLLQKQLSNASENSSVIFLGDNIYPSGFPLKSEGKEAKERAKNKLKSQLDALDDFKGRPYFIPGNHDWRGNGVLGVRRQEKYIEKHFNKGIEDEDDWEDYFYPDNGCGDPTIVEVNERLVFLFIDSNWYLKDWDKEHPSLNDGCNVKSRPVFRFQFEELARKYKNKNVIIASHHPIYTNGPHGGKSTIKEHIFPLTQLSDELYIPIPVLGTLGAGARALFGTRQDVAHPIYRRYITDVMAGATKNGSFIFASGHEHNLQYIERQNQKFIVSGAGSKKSPVTLGQGAKFAYGGKGFSKVDFYEDGSAWLYFYRPTEDGKGELLYTQKIKDKLPISEDNIPKEFPEYDANEKVVNHSPTLMEVEESKGGLHNFILGKHYRELYANKYDFPVLKLEDFQGVGAVPIKRGGGNQTNSLRLKTSDGRQFAMRALTKDASRLVPYPINKMTAAKSIAEESFMSTHPFAPLVIPKLADAANVYHTNPKLYYVPKQPALGVQNDLFGGDVYLIEERPSKGHEAEESFGKAEKFYSTPDVANKIRHSSKHKIDQNWVLRSRLFDMLVGDWDRHDDQWRWHMHKEDGKKIYRPIPRDRDQAFSKYDGVVSWAARLFMPFLRQLKVYEGEIKNQTRWDNWSSRFFNMTFLNEIPWEEWEKEAKFIKENVTDEIIEAAFRDMPAYAYDETAAGLIQKLKQRRDDMEKYAREFYEFYSDEVVVLGTDKKERFEITRKDKGQVLVEVFHKDEKTYSRLFDHHVTKEIHLYGLGNDDKFKIKGKTLINPLIRVIGGEGDDEINDESHVTGLSKKTKVYDNIGGIKIQSSGETKDKTSRYKLLNYFDRRDVQYEHDFNVKSPIIGFNIDDGFILGARYGAFNYKFKKYPFANEHHVTASYAFNTQAPDVRYRFGYNEVLGRWDFIGDLHYQGSRNTHNFFGFGNESTQNKDNRRYNEVRMHFAKVNLGIQKRFANNNAHLKFFAQTEWNDVEATENRLVTETDEFPENVFDSKIYVGGGTSFDFINLNNFANPKQGVKFNLSYIWRALADDLATNFAWFTSDLTFYLPLDRKQNFVFATRVGFKHNFEEEYEFYYGHSIGGQFLRGFRNERFLGKTAFYHNNDFRLKILSSTNNVLPFSIGLHGGLDYGRVWLEDDNSDKIHFGYGGGFWVSPVNIAILSFGYYQSEDDNVFIVKVGHSF